MPLLPARLRERKLVQWTLGYVAAAWGALQVLSFFTSEFALPDGIVRAATVFLAVAFLGVLIVAWHHGERGRQRVAPVEVLALAGILILSTGAAAAVFRRSPPVDLGPLPSNPPPGPSVAVLPFRDLSANADSAYFSDQITVEILNVLAAVEDLHVASATSSFRFKGEDVDIREAAASLGVGAILEGSVRRRGAEVRIAVQLVDAKSGFQMWAETYEGHISNLFEVQEEIARSIAGALSVELMAADSARLAHRGTEDLDAYTLYLRANATANLLTEPALRSALDLYGQALAADPGFAAAHAGMARTWAQLADDWVAPTEAYPRSLAASRDAISADSLEDSGHEVLGFAQLAFEWDLEEAIQSFDRALELNPNNAKAFVLRGVSRQLMGDFEAARRDIQRAVLLDPLAGVTPSYRGRLFLHQRDWQAAIADANRTLEVNPGFLMSYRILGDAYLGLGDPRQALASYRRGLSIDPGWARLRTAEVRALAIMGRRQEAHAQMLELESERSGRYLRAEELAQGWAALGESDRAFKLLEEAFAERSAGMPFLDAWPAYDPIRDDVRFEELRSRVGLPRRSGTRRPR